MKAIEQFFPVELFVMLYKVVLTFESVGATQKNTTTIQGSVPLYPYILYVPSFFF